MLGQQLPRRSLFDMSGDVVGVVVAQISALRMMEAGQGVPQNLNFAIQVPLVVNFLSIKRRHSYSISPRLCFSAKTSAMSRRCATSLTALDTAFLYRKQLVTNCTCNGKNALGLASFDVKRDPTLRPGDIISTKEGLLAYTGRSQQGAAFTPVNPTTLPVNIRPTSSQPRVADPGTIVQPQRPLPANPPSGRLD